MPYELYLGSKMTRQRVEDLGRILELLNALLENELFDKDGKGWPRNKDFSEFAMSWSDEKKEEFFHDFIYSLDHITEKLFSMREIAIGEDYINEIQRQMEDRID